VTTAQVERAKKDKLYNPVKFRGILKNQHVMMKRGSDIVLRKSRS